MSKLLIEFYSGEIPARLQKMAEEQLKNLFDKYAELEGLDIISYSYSTVYRLILYVENLPKILPKYVLEKKGPAVNSPESHIENFAKSNNITVSDLQIKQVKNAEFYFYIEEQESKNIKEILAKIFTQITENFHWPKSMRWGDHKIRWIRPLHNIIFMLDNEIIEANFGHLNSNNKLFINKYLFECNNVEDYFRILDENKIIYNRITRKEKILDDITSLIGEENHINPDENLLEELLGLTEIPMIKMGKIDKEFMSLPPEVLDLVMSHHQKYLSIYNKENLITDSFFFLTIDRKEADYPKIIKNNEQVLRNRFKDAEFFYRLDQEKSLEEMVDQLKNITYHNELGNYHQKVIRIEKISNFLASSLKSPNLSEISRAAYLCKADLASHIVDELPELQGIMGYYYSLNSGETKNVSLMIRDHYLPSNKQDFIPIGDRAFISIADKLDSIVGMFLTGNKPTGSKDPYAVRRSALGIIKMIIENEFSLNLGSLIGYSLELYSDTKIILDKKSLISEIKEFFLDRMIFLLKKDFEDHIIKSILIPSENFDIYDNYVKILSLNNFTKNNDIKIIDSMKRVYNILNSAEDQIFEPNLLKEEAELELFENLSKIEIDYINSVKEKLYDKSFILLNQLAAPINKFLDQVTINSENILLKNNRLALLKKIRKLSLSLLDFSKFAKPGE